ncbi:MAG: hypothetical protein K0A94_12575 [Desulfuromonadales bacterium]|nr:hypothetical protein [Desulfuromonadales bacterium]
MMVLIYLMLSFGSANAAFWCQADENSSHLEVNPVGKCWINCSPDSAVLQPGLAIPQSAGLFFSLDDQCLDSPVFTAARPTSKPTNLLNKNVPSSFDTSYLPCTPKLNVGIRHLANHNRPGYLPEAQPLKVLRTVVLLR